MRYEINLRVIRDDSGKLIHNFIIDGLMLDLARNPEEMAVQQFREAFKKLRALELESRNWSEEDWESRARRQWLDPEPGMRGGRTLQEQEDDSYNGWNER